MHAVLASLPQPVTNVTKDGLGLPPPASGSGAGLQRHLASLIVSQLLLQVSNAQR
jgi:hypothetical protein